MNSKQKVVALGEVLWDIFPSEKHLGGAPFNFSYHCNQLGLDSVIASAVGQDELGDEIIQKTKEFGISDKYIKKNNFPTGTVRVTLNHKNQPEYEITENVAWDNLELDDDLKNLAKNTQVFCFGSLASRSEKTRQTTKKFLTLLPKNCIKIFDINLRQDYYSKELIDFFLGQSNVLKINDEEMDVMSQLFNWKNLNEYELLKKIQKKYDLNLIILTRGSSGSILFDGKIKSENRGFPTNVKDPVGAGDSFTAMIAYGLINNWRLEKMNNAANKLASLVCSFPGATPKIENIEKILQPPEQH